MFQRLRTSRETLSELERVEALTRARFGLTDAELVLVSEDDTALPEGPRRAVTILFWTGTESRHRLRIFKPLPVVTEHDLPPRWLRSALRDDGEGDCC